MPHVSATDVRRTQFPPYTDAIYEPAVLDAKNRVALLRNWFVRFPLNEPVTVTEVSLDYGRIWGITINTNTNNLVIHFTDRSVGWYDLSKNALVHKFQPAGDMQGVVVSQDGKRAFVLRSDGRVEGWDLTAFAADGWAKRMNQ